jgi:hypothetical protein
MRDTMTIEQQNRLQELSKLNPKLYSAAEKHEMELLTALLDSETATTKTTDKKVEYKTKVVKPE